MEKRKINSIILHCSYSQFGNVDLIDQWHKERGWHGCGYHYVITNGVIKAHEKYLAFHDGLVQVGRDINKTGAHCKGRNTGSIGICLIGRHTFTAKQLYSALPELLSKLMFDHSLTIDQVHGHFEFSRQKSCPNISKEIIRKIAEFSV
ncbi:MAG: N-acetylmuramoyl-L-alanine amidase [Desulfobacteraceae bacterium]|nr:N-acetylmuramoyl-L-alanine amidase [Desulfobacteraceae bacterium]